MLSSFYQLKLRTLGGKVRTAPLRNKEQFHLQALSERILVEPLDPVLDGTTRRTKWRFQFALLHLVLDSVVGSQLWNWKWNVCILQSSIVSDLDSSFFTVCSSQYLHSSRAHEVSTKSCSCSSKLAGQFACMCNSCFSSHWKYPLVFASARPL